MLEVFKVCLVRSEPGDRYDCDIDVHLVCPLQGPPFPVITAQSHRSCAYTASEVHLIDVGQISRDGKEGETRSVTAEEGGVHKSVAGRYSS